MPILNKYADTVLSVENVSLSYGTREILSEVTFFVLKGEKVGLVGPNGAGKTTLLKIIDGQLELDTGSVRFLSKPSLAYWPQELTADEQKTLVNDYLDLSGEVNKLWHRLGLNPDLQKRRLKELSGGEQSKVRLLKILSAVSDIVLLDEPTNNLDFIGLEILADFIKQSRATFIIVSHDRYLLDQVADKIIELGGSKHSSNTYAGNYTAYKEAKEARIKKQWQEYEDYLAEARRLKKTVREKEDWTVKAFKPKITDNFRSIQGPIDWSTRHFGAVVKNTKRRLEQLKVVDKPEESLPLHFDLSLAGKVGNLAFNLEDLLVKAGNKNIGPFNFDINGGQRVILNGPNGAGKTSFVETIIGRRPPVSGSVNIGSWVKVGYLSQFPQIDEDQAAIEFFKQSSVEKDEDKIRRQAAKFGLTYEIIRQPFVRLSPGQRSRFFLALLAASNANCLVLDEPSNNLDLESLSALEEALQNYHGTIIAVSHDKYFIERLRADKIISLTNV